MITRAEIDALSQTVEASFQRLESRIMMDLINRLSKYSEPSATTTYEINKLKELGESETNIKRAIRDTLHLTDKQVNTLFTDNARDLYDNAGRLYALNGEQQPPIKDNPGLIATIDGIKRQTDNSFRNITGSLGFAFKDPANHIRYKSLRQFYTDTLDDAMLDIHSGAFSYQTVLQRTVNKMTNSGLRYIEWESGHGDRVEVAARRAIMKGYRQVQQEITDITADDLDAEYFEVSAHSGARPEHAEWQGGIYTKDELYTVCGLDDALGLCGINCYHSYEPYFPGLSTRRYSQEKLDAMNEQDATPQEYGDTEYTKYDALQHQRALERSMRKYAQAAELLEAGGADDDAILNTKIKFNVKYAQYKDFSRAMALPLQRDRIFIH